MKYDLKAERKPSKILFQSCLDFLPSREGKMLYTDTGLGGVHNKNYHRSTKPSQRHKQILA